MNKPLKMATLSILVIFAVFFTYRILFVRTVVHNNGMDANEATAARFRWELFEGWVKSRPQYKGWESNPELFKKANKEFRDTVRTNVEVVK